MRNWFIILMIFVLPMALFAYLDAKAQNAMMCKVNQNNEITDSKVKIIKFSSPMCSECKEASNELDKISKDYGNSVIIEEINVTQNAGKEGQYTKDAIKKYKVTLVPTLIFIDKNGKLVHRQEGAMKSKDIKEIIDENK